MNESHSWGLFFLRASNFRTILGGEMGSASGGFSKHLPSCFAQLGGPCTLYFPHLLSSNLSAAGYRDHGWKHAAILLDIHLSLGIAMDHH